MNDYKHLKLYPNDFVNLDIWKQICEVCDTDPQHEMLVITFKADNAYSEETI